MKTILTPPLPMRLKIGHSYDKEFEYVIGMSFELSDNDDEVNISYICTNAVVYNDFDYTPQCFIDGDWHDWE